VCRATGAPLFGPSTLAISTELLALNIGTSAAIDPEALPVSKKPPLALAASSLAW